MRNTRRISHFLFLILTLSAAAFLLASTGCSEKADWEKINDKLIAEKNIEGRTRGDIPETNIVSNLEPGVVASITELPVTEIAPGVTARLYWGKGALISWMILEPNAEIPQETLPSERLMLVRDGSVEQLIDGHFVTMSALKREEPDGTHGGTPKNEFVYLQKGSENAVKIGAEGAEILEVYWPVRLDYLEKSGVTDLPSDITMGDYPLEPSILPDRVYDLYDVQFTELVPGANARLISTSGTQLSFLRMDPASIFGHHIHPEEQLMIVIRGWIDENILDEASRMEKLFMSTTPMTMRNGGMSTAIRTILSGPLMSMKTAQSRMG